MLIKVSNHVEQRKHDSILERNRRPRFRDRRRWIGPACSLRLPNIQSSSVGSSAAIGRLWPYTSSVVEICACQAFTWIRVLVPKGGLEPPRGITPNGF